MTKAIDFRMSLIERIKHKQEEIHRWLKAQEGSHELPLYSSVDLRDAGFKMAVVDTNIFPSGFNNLCEHGLEDSVKFIRQAILKRAHKCRHVLIIAEEHTRNTWYLENIRILQQIIEKAGFNTKIATFLTIQPAFCQDANALELETATGYPVKIHCLHKILSKFESGQNQFDLIIMNNDLTTGIPEILKSSKVPIYPSIQAGWHSRLKSQHFFHSNALIGEFSKILDVDLSVFSCLYAVVNDVNINVADDRKKLNQAASELFEKVRNQYKKYHINEKPYILLKSDSGTYGMGVMPIEDPQDILTLNRKSRNKLYKGKNSKIIERFLIQEGVPTIYNIDQEISEVCIYQIENNLVGGFYRSHSTKGERDNLNTQGMVFKKMCPHLSKYGNCGVHHDVNVFDIYRLLARIASIAAQREIIDLEAHPK